MASHWRPLKLGTNEPHIPSLIVKYEIGLLYYKVYLSDLTWIWMESLERKEIVRRALNVDTSIDPSEGGDQLQLMLRYIRKGLDAEEGTMISLSNSGVSRQLILRTTIPLPGTLKPLVWPIHLLPAPQPLFTAELFLPNLSQHFLATAQIASLIQIIKDKDRVIARFIEKMQLDGSDLSKIFPGVSGPRSTAKSNFREFASNFVKGLGEFEVELWRKLFYDSIQVPNIQEVLPQVLSSDLENIPQSTIEDIEEDWWQNLKRGDTQKSDETDCSVPVPLERVPSAAPPPISYEIDGANTTGFQQRANSAIKESENAYQKPTTLAIIDLNDALSKKIAITCDENGDSTTDDSDGNSESSMSNHKHGKPSVQSSVRPSSEIFSRSNIAVEAESHTSEAEKYRNHQAQPNICESDPQTLHQANPGIENEATPISTITSHKAKDEGSTLMPKPKPRLGKIGGIGKLKAISDLRESDRLPDAPKSTPLRDTREVTTDKTSSLSRTADIDSLRSAQVSLPRKSISPQPETSHERADNRRDQLKRDLAKNSMTQARKKRKF